MLRGTLGNPGEPTELTQTELAHVTKNLREPRETDRAGTCYGAELAHVTENLGEPTEIDVAGTCYGAELAHVTENPGEPWGTDKAHTDRAGTCSGMTKA